MIIIEVYGMIFQDFCFFLPMSNREHEWCVFGLLHSALFLTIYCSDVDKT
jgi:hypothetical protein